MIPGVLVLNAEIPLCAYANATAHDEVAEINGDGKDALVT
jgi:hypothetical protein